jgi:1,2-diacylglycerol 3-beta-glucosyltransferase
MLRDILGGFALACIALGIVQLAFLLGVGSSEVRRARRRNAKHRPSRAAHVVVHKRHARGRETAPDGEPPDTRIQAIYALVPCLNEELVIADTVRELLKQDPLVRVVVIDDASEDDTSARAKEAGEDRLAVVRRRLPNARQGKGPALNAGFARICREVAEAGYEHERVLILVMDADGRMSDGAVERVKPLFACPDIGGAQLGVRIRNRDRNMLTLIQDCEFWGIAALGQMGRVRTGTVSLGGNGQFTRLAALLTLGERPWSDSLTEDLDLAVRLSVVGWRLTSTPTAWVSQQGIERVKPLIRQRARWFQGHMTTANRRIREVWSSETLSNMSVLELTAYLFIPYLIVLPWSILAQVGIVYVVIDQTAPAPPGDERWPMALRIVTLLAWYLISFAPTVACGVIYARRERQISMWRAIGFSHVLVLWNYVLFTACWRAVFRMLSGRTSWAKTARLAEVPATVTA